MTHRYPELLQQGESAYGKPITDGQHRDDFIKKSQPSARDGTVQLREGILTVRMLTE